MSPYEQKLLHAVKEIAQVLREIKTAPDELKGLQIEIFERTSGK